MIENLLYTRASVRDFTHVPLGRWKIARVSVVSLKKQEIAVSEKIVCIYVENRNQDMKMNKSPAPGNHTFCIYDFD